LVTIYEIASGNALLNNCIVCLIFKKGTKAQAN